MAEIGVIGGGPAGMMAAITAAKAGSKVVLFEKKPRLGSKLRITGKGRCNITSAEEDLQNFISSYPGNGRFLFSALHEFSNYDLIRFLNGLGVETKVERGKRVFPVSDDADEVVNALNSELKRIGVRIRLSSEVEDVCVEGGRVTGIKAEGEFFPFDAIVIATGGLSYPGTGSTGDGYRFAEKVGHKIITPFPGLVPLVVEEAWVKDLQGLSLKNVRAASYTMKGKKINEEFGEMLFTHYGLSGPIILSMSRDIVSCLREKGGKVKVFIDLKPALDEEKLDKRLQRDLAKYARRRFKNGLDDLLPGKLIPVIINLSGIDKEKPCHQITREERRRLLELLKNLNFTVNGTRPIAEAIVTAGGVNVKEINPKTMESKLIKGLFFAGEVIDVDGYTGGFNLQAAFSTGFVAGKYAHKINNR
ncbi:NAD(P)/FAD-dependent oxidoreductase [Thermosyntropha sp.]|uniref:NAD(P)/FAD-dependent oxidoreductase n=1 Tax=Thermosyntropha sp. TaxID=2740820 RepID=UPI0025CEE0FD|nr:NAD(P)/FAD-dependent oxidoreductase [Thermosyntropha sp.]MBO8158109.1 NAD(P)/FAD-dependent oxidoreductase [Thermosyntropha sp.]